MLPSRFLSDAPARRLLRADGLLSPPVPGANEPLLGVRRHLSARQPGAIKWAKLPDSGAQVPGKEFLGLHPQNLRQDEHLHVGHAAALLLQLGDGLAAGVPAEKLHFHREVTLRPNLAQAQLLHLWPDDVELCG